MRLRFGAGRSSSLFFVPLAKAPKVRARDSAINVPDQEIQTFIGRSRISSLRAQGGFATGDPDQYQADARSYLGKHCPAPNKALPANCKRFHFTLLRYPDVLDDLLHVLLWESLGQLALECKVIGVLHRRLGDIGM